MALSPENDSSRQRDRRLLRFISFAASLLFLAFLLPLIADHSGVIEGKRYFWLFDDAMISMRYAHNFARGFGLVWNPGERIEGYTNFLWVVYMAGLHLLPIPLSHTSLAVLVSNAVLGIATLVGVSRLVRCLGGGPVACALAAVALATNVDFLFWTASGLETTALTCAFTWAVVLIFEMRDAPSSGGGERWQAFALPALLPLIRVDAALLSFCLYALALALSSNRKRALKLIALGVALLLCHELFRVLYYGDFIPNTARLKTTGWPGRFAAGRGYVATILFEYWPIFCLAAWGAIAQRRRRVAALLAIVALSLGYTAYAGGDAFPYNRFLAPCLPLLFAASAVVLLAPLQGIALGSVPASTRKLRVGLVTAGVAALIVWFQPNFVLRRPNATYWNGIDEGNARISLLLGERLPKTARVAAFCAGIPFYFNDCYGIDMLGKMDRHIALKPVSSSGTKPGHNKWDFDFSLRTLKADYVLPNFKGPLTTEQARKLAQGDWGFDGALYFHPTFARDYYPYPLPWDTIRTIYAFKGRTATK